MISKHAVDADVLVQLSGIRDDDLFSAARQRLGVSLLTWCVACAQGGIIRIARSAGVIPLTRPCLGKIDGADLCQALAGFHAELANGRS